MANTTDWGQAMDRDRRQERHGEQRKLLTVVTITAAVTAVFSILVSLSLAYLTNAAPLSAADVQRQIELHTSATVTDVERNRTGLEAMRQTVEQIDKRTVRIEALLEQLLRRDAPP
jgi:hypothetical protein